MGTFNDKQIAQVEAPHKSAVETVGTDRPNGKASARLKNIS
jgi:hypothetical protein